MDISYCLPQLDFKEGEFLTGQNMTINILMLYIFLLILNLIQLNHLPNSLASEIIESEYLFNATVF